MYRSVVISVIVICSLFPIVIQKDLWPFSAYSMFSSNLSNTALKQYRGFSLLGVSGDSPEFNVDSRLITGAFHPGMIGVAVNSLVANGRLQCVDEVLQYWGRRYVEHRSLLPIGSREIEKLVLIEHPGREFDQRIRRELSIDKKN